MFIDILAMCGRTPYFTGRPLTEVAIELDIESSNRYLLQVNAVTSVYWYLSWALV
jgi:hypothetical protein